MGNSCSSTKSPSTGRLNRKTRLARQLITTMQLAVAATFSDRVNLDPLAGPESLERFRDFLSEVGVPEAAIGRISQYAATWHMLVADGRHLEAGGEEP